MNCHNRNICLQWQWFKGAFPCQPLCLCGRYGLMDTQSVLMCWSDAHPVWVRWTEGLVWLGMACEVCLTLVLYTRYFGTLLHLKGLVLNRGPDLNSVFQCVCN